MNCDKQDFCSTFIPKFLQDYKDSYNDEEDNAVNLLWSFNQWVLKQQNSHLQEVLEEKEETTKKVHRLVDALTRLHQIIEEKDQQLLNNKNEIEYLESQLESNNNNNVICLKLYTNSKPITASF